MPPGLDVRLISRVIIGPPELMGEHPGPESQIGPSPLSASFSYRSGFGTHLLFRGHLLDPPDGEEEVQMALDVYTDGEDFPLVGAGDLTKLGRFNALTGFVLGAFYEGYVEPSAEEAGG